MKDKCQVLSALNTCVHHELVGPLDINLELSKRLINQFDALQLPSELREMVQTIFVSSKQVKLHANDLLD